MTEGTTAPIASSAPNTSSANPSPKKKKATASKAKSSTNAAHPKYSEMIKAALKALNDRGGSSRAAILKFVLANYSLDPVQANQHLKLALKNGVKSKHFKQTKGNGASGSFKLAAEVTATKKKKTSKPKKTVSASSTAAAAGTKKRARSKSAGSSKPAKKVATASNTSSSAAAATPTAAAKPKKVKIAKATKARSSATPKSSNAAKATKKPKQGQIDRFSPSVEQRFSSFSQTQSQGQCCETSRCEESGDSEESDDTESEESDGDAEESEITGGEETRASEEGSQAQSCCSEETRRNEENGRQVKLRPHSMKKFKLSIRVVCSCQIFSFVFWSMIFIVTIV